MAAGRGAGRARGTSGRAGRVRPPAAPAGRRRVAAARGVTGGPGGRGQKNLWHIKQMGVDGRLVLVCVALILCDSAGAFSIGRFVGSEFLGAFTDRNPFHKEDCAQDSISSLQ